MPPWPAAASVLLVVMPWQPTLVTFGLIKFVAAVGIFQLTPRLAVEPATFGAPDTAARGAGGKGSQRGFALLLSIGIIDSATRMAFLTFLPFILLGKGASLPTIGLALTLVFAGGAAGKLVCAFIGARVGAIRTVYLTEGLTAAGVVAILPLSLDALLLLLPIIGIALNGTSSVLYGSVPELVRPEKRARAFGMFYTGTIGSGALAPALYGLVGDALGVTATIVMIAAICLVAVPLAYALKPNLAHVRL